MIIYHLFVNGTPKAQPRPRMAVNGHVYNPKSADAWKEEIIAAFLPYKRQPITGPVQLQVIFFMPIPKGMKANENEKIPHTKKPDTDNLLKAVMDSMTTAGVWKDDALAFSINAKKLYGKKTGAQIVVETGF